MRRRKLLWLPVQLLLGAAVGLAASVWLSRPEPQPAKLLPGPTPPVTRQASLADKPPAPAASPWKSPGETAALSLNFSPYYLPGSDPDLQTPLSEEAIRNALAAIVPFSDTIRTFGVSGELAKLYPIAKNEFSFRVIAGCWIGREYTDAEIDEELRLLAELGNSGLADILVVGSECLLRRDFEAEDLLGWMARVRGMLTRDVPVGTSDGAAELIGRPELLDGADVVLFTHYPYLSGKNVEDGIADFEDTLHRLRVAAGGTPLICSETGWKADDEGAANASPENAARYLDGMIALGEREDIEIIHFEAIMEGWKMKYYDDGWGFLNADLTPRAELSGTLRRVEEQKREEGAS